MRHTQTWILRLLLGACVLVLPACLLVPGPAAGSSECATRGDCVGQGTSACEEYVDASTCESQGCAWGAYCAGSATPCAYLAGSNCDQQEGCAWDDTSGTCGGSEGPCEAFVGTACIYQMGCEDAYGCLGN